MNFRLLKDVETGPALHLAVRSDNLLRQDFPLNLKQDVLFMGLECGCWPMAVNRGLTCGCIVNTFSF